MEEAKTGNTAPKTYPYGGWVLQPSFKPKEVTFTQHSPGWNGADYGCVSQGGKIYRRKEIHATKDEAIGFGNKEVARMQADIEKKQRSLDKKREALAKAATP